MNANTDRWIFGRVEVRPARRQVLVDGRPVNVGSRAFDVLVTLVERRDRLVGKAELLDTVWGHSSVEENNLAVQISALRRCLGAAIITTVPGRGYQFVADAWAGPESPVASAQAVDQPSSHGLLAAAPGLVGREHELADLIRAVKAHRLVSVVGEGGAGKSMLASHVGHSVRASGGWDVAWIDVGDLRTEDDLKSSIALVLQSNAGGGRPLLVVLDQAEQLVDAAARAALALLAMPYVRVLATSQTPLRLHAEMACRIGGLAYPDRVLALRDVLQFPAVALLADRVRSINRVLALREEDVPHAIEICRRLEGLPLALELAAHRVAQLGVQRVAETMDSRLQALRGGYRGTPPRHRSLRASLERSYSLLAPREQDVLLKLSVLPAGLTLERAMKALARADLDTWSIIDALDELARRSLLRLGTGQDPRHTLPESVRLFCLEYLAEGKGPRECDERFAAASRRGGDPPLRELSRRLDGSAALVRRLVVGRARRRISTRGRRCTLAPASGQSN